MKTHRCEESLKSNVSIRYCRFMEGYNLDLDWNREIWGLYHYEFDIEWEYTIQKHVSEIKYCPYCGEKLG